MTSKRIQRSAADDMKAAAAISERARSKRRARNGAISKKARRATRSLAKKRALRGEPLSKRARARIVELVEAYGTQDLHEVSGLSETAIMRAAAGLSILAGTRRLIRDLFDQYAELEDNAEVGAAALDPKGERAPEAKETAAEEE